MLNDRISNFIHAYTLYSAVRPFGVSIILAANDPHTGPELYMIEPSGTAYVSSQHFVKYFEICLDFYDIDRTGIVINVGILRLCNWKSEASSQN